MFKKTEFPNWIYRATPPWLYMGKPQDFHIIVWYPMFPHSEYRILIDTRITGEPDSKMDMFDDTMFNGVSLDIGQDLWAQAEQYILNGQLDRLIELDSAEWKQVRLEEPKKDIKAWMKKMKRSKKNA
jgi:hypothetical protein